MLIKRGAVFSGGGAKGAYQVGALLYLLGELQRRYDVYCGISVGALNASFLSMFPSGFEKQAITNLKDIWDTVDDRRIYKNRYPVVGTVISAVLSALAKKSLYDSSPLISLVGEKLDREKIAISGKFLRVGAVSINTGKYRVWGEDSLHIKEAVLASSAFPLFFNPIEIEGEYWTDGGVREISPLQQAINMGCTHIDVISLSELQMQYFDAKRSNLVRHGPRVLDIMATEVAATDFHVDNPKGAKISILRPSRPLLDNSLDFNPVKIQRNIDLGYEESKEHVWT